MLKIKQRILEALTDYLKGKGYKKFRSDLESMEKTNKIVSEETKKEYHPDLTARYLDGKFLFEIEIADEPDEETLVEKCRVLSEAAEKLNGKLNLVVPVETYDKILQILNANKLENIGLLQINMK
ncbi:MAG: hypothetical protein K9G47_11255 [Bacteroidales bacterium]|nr:hypothetical protein [Bacteroidales bacterium]MCF8388449.1 hypothetical protein [Bacteroidales bacterium]